MRPRKRGRLASLLLSGTLLFSFALAIAGLVTVPAGAQDPQPPHGSGRSGPPVLASIADLPSTSSGESSGPIPFSRLVNDQEYARLKEAAKTAPLSPNQTATVQADSAGATVMDASSPALVSRFSGIPDSGWFTPDAAIAAGPDQVLVAVNYSFQVFTKSGASLLGPRSFYDLYASFNLPANTYIFDPRAVYDPSSGRWFMVTVAQNSDYKISYLMVSVSATGDATGSWCTYNLDATLDGATPSNNWADYDTIGMDSEAVYLGADMTDWSTDFNFQYSKLRILNKSQLTSCGPADWNDLWGITDATGKPAFTLQPALSFGAPAEYIVDSNGSSGNYITVWKLKDPLSSPSLENRTTISVPAYSIPPQAPQLGTTTLLDTGDTRLQAVTYRNGSLWVAHTTAYDWGSGDVAAIRWYEIDPVGLNVNQWGTFGSNGMYYFCPTIMPDSDGLGMVFNVSAPNQYAGIRYAGRVASDPGGDISNSGTLQDGVGPFVRLDPLQPDRASRWGDYTAAAVDPIDGTIWIFGEYAAGSNDWGTWIGQLSLPTPLPSPTPASTYTPSPTPTATFTRTPLPTATFTPTPTQTPTPEPTPTETPTPTLTNTPTPMPTATATPTSSPTASPTPAPVPAPTLTPTPAPTPTISPARSSGLRIYLPVLSRDLASGW